MSTQPIPRTIRRPCTGGCQCQVEAPNPDFYRDMRTRAKLTLTEMARLCSLSRKVSVQYLSQMERGERVFQPEFMALYVRLFTRYTKAGDES